jgi:hypothetical protein
MPFPGTRTLHPDWSAWSRPVVAGAMGATCELYGALGPGEYDPATMTTAATRGPALWVGPCRVQTYAGQATAGDQAGQEVTTRDYLVQLDETGEPVPRELAEGWAVVVTVCPNDASLIGRPLPVTDVMRGSERAARDVVVTDNLG